MNQEDGSGNVRLNDWLGDGETLKGEGVEKIEAVWSASLDCECPACKEEVDLMEEPDFWDGKPELQIAQDVKGLEVVCPKCGHEFEVDTVW